MLLVTCQNKSTHIAEIMMLKAVAGTRTMVLSIHMEILVLATLEILIGVEITTPKRSRQTKCVVHVEVVEINLTINSLPQLSLCNK